MLLRSYSFNRELTCKELELFSYLVENPDYKCEVVYDVLHNAMEGRIDLNKEFNLLGYEAKVRRNTILGAYNKDKKEKSYDAQISSTSDLTLKDTLVEPRDEIESMLEETEYASCIKFLDDNRLYHARNINKGCLLVDLHCCLKKALNGVPDAVSLLKLLCDNDTNIRDCIEAILKHGIDDEFKKYLMEVY